MIPYGRQSISEDDVAAVVEVLRSDWLTQGPTVPRFEKAVAAKAGAQHAVAMSSATAALHVACLALDLGPGDRLWTSPNSFVASANCGLYCGARVDFVDIDPRTYNMSVAALHDKLERAARTGELPKVVVPVDFGGQSCELREMRTLGERYGFKILEDASHAIGGRYLDRPVGSCAYSDIAVFSFHPVKIITTGEGGMALTNDAALAARMARLRTHGVTRDAASTRGEFRGPWAYAQLDLGFNYRMTDLQAALGLSQHGRIDEFIARRREIAALYDAELAGLPLILPYRGPHADSALHLYVVQVDDGAGARDRRAVYDALRAAGIGVNVHYIPIYTQPFYQALGFVDGYCSESERYARRALSLPMYAGLGRDGAARVIAAVRGALAA
jgi:UDP-4-amino-4,6-dideoxy-N-acetyl-beta-L-altrosamine transaminase